MNAPPVNPGSEEVTQEQVYRCFQEGAHAFGMAPFWFWNGSLEEAEIRRQVRLMAQAHLPAFTISGRTPLETPYLSDAWMEAVEVACDEARKRGLRVWIYDELNCPSGRAGGLVLRSGPHLAQKFLIARDSQEGSLASLPDRGLLGVFACERSGETLLGWRDLTHEAFVWIQGRQDPPIRPHTPLLTFSVESALDYYPPDRWGEANVDILDPEAVSKFIQITYEAYLQALEGYFGNTLMGFFTDEPGPFPGYCSSLPPMCLPWTPGLPEIFREEHGYDLLEALPLLFLDHNRSSCVRHDFWKTLTRRFREVYLRPLREWCEGHGVLLTGHFICETPLRWQVASNGAIMPLLSELHWPGVDSAGREGTLSQDQDALVEIKMAASVARQLGKERVMSELFGRRGWHLPISERKTTQDWESVLGADFFVPHALYFTVRGKAKRIKPLTSFYQQPYWQHYASFSNYFARLGYLLSQGQRQADILLLMPTDSLWATQKPQDSPWQADSFAWISKEFTCLSASLMAAHLDHDYGDETLLSELGSVAGGELVLGEARYRALLIPPGLSIRGTTLDLIADMVVQGGLVIAVEPVPILLNGGPPADGLLDNLLADDFVVHIVGHSFQEKTRALEAILDERLTQAFRLTDFATDDKARRILCQRRVLGEMEIYFLVHQDQSPIEVWLECLGEGYLEEWNPSDGSRRALPSRSASGTTAAALEFGPCQSRLVIFHPGKEPPAPSSAPAEAKPLSWEALEVASWQVLSCDPNVLALDFCRFASGASPDFGDETIGIWEARARAIRAARAYGNTSAWLEFAFEIAVSPQALGAVSLAVEDLRCYEVWVNSQPVSLPPELPFFRDIGLKQVDISPFLREGANTILLKREIVSGEEIEPVFLTGDFGVESVSGWEMFERADDLATSGWLNPWRGDYTTDGLPLLAGGPFRLMARPGTISSGSWADQGFPFFAGTLVCQAEIVLTPPNPPKRLVLALEDFKDVARITLNHQEAATLLWPPYECDITDFLRSGPNLLTMEITNTLRNLFGPHHHKSPGEERYLFIRDGLPSLWLRILDPSPSD